ncbi:hypothetical protein [Lyngbya sp. CCY1209]|uniref:hypothetical protein n=1 Tax=Lyngbya sp. CCY1209 TaxID=2886103 RepID=UPI002D212863|nr:hypothetical protein [Lyngbya sp. CCY1209]MEB3884074.1 hypothetical protein [Lyngbya sp. CCY1209]
MTDSDGDGGAAQAPEKLNRIDFQRISLFVKNRLKLGAFVRQNLGLILFPTSMLLTSLLYFLLGITISHTTSNLCNRWGDNLIYYSRIELWRIFWIKQTPVNPINSTYYNKRTPYPDLSKYLDSAILSTLHQERIKAQIYTIRNRAITNLRIARDMYYWLTIFTTMTCIATVIAGVAASTLIRKGWDGVGDVTKGIFITSVTVSLFTASFTTVFQLEENAETHMTLYQTYVNLEEYLFTALALKGLPASRQTTDNPPLPPDYPENLIGEINKTLQTYSLTFKLNAESIPDLNEVIDITGLSNGQ